MLLLLCRHAAAVDKSGNRYPDDRDRPLVAEGRRRQRRVSRRLRKHGLVPTRILSSPWKRAWQTAGILAKETGAGKESRSPSPPLAESPKLPAIMADLQGAGPDEVIALVGHEPWMSELASLLLAPGAPELSIAFAKSGVMGIRLEGDGSTPGELLFFWGAEDIEGRDG